MKKLFLPVLLLLISNSIFSQNINRNFVDGEIYVKLKQKPNSLVHSTNTVDINVELPFLAKYSNIFTFADAKKSFYTTSSENLQKIYRLKLKKPEIINLVLEKLKNDAAVAYVEKVPLRNIISTPNDPSVGSQWALTKIQAFDSWNINAGNTDIVVAIVDNAIQSNHVDLQANMLPGYDYADDDNDTNPPNTDFSHGTHTSGIAGAVSNNSIGIASAGNNHIKILPVKATPDLGDSRGIYYGYESITWAADNGAKIISCSWGGPGFSQTEQDVIDYCFSKNIIVVAAAGNDNTANEGYPGAYNHVIAVASTETDDSKSSFSTYGTWVDISAPGRGILSTVPFDTYASFSGTSMATPLVASVLGYIWSCFPSLTPTQLETILKNTADNIDSQNPGYLGKLGAGRINLLKAIACPNGGLSTANISTNSSTYICQGDTVLLNATTPGNNLTYSWLKDGQALNISTANLTTTNIGNYQVIISQANCSLISNTISVTSNQLLSTSPNVTNVTVNNCVAITAGNGLQATAANCNFGGPTTFNYNGPTIGYDGFNSSGADPNAIISNLGGLVSEVKVSITWQKIDGGDETTCGIADGGAVPYNDEVSFKLKSPKGTVITLLAGGIYASGTHTSGIVTTVFQDGGAVIAQNSLPTSGTFAPNVALSTFLNEAPNGTWTLLPQDDGLIDPLCVQAFSITVTTNSPNQPSQITWWDASTGGSQIANGTEYIPNINNFTGIKTYYAQSKCVGLCPSERTPANVTVNQAFVFSKQPLNSNICSGQNAYFSVDSPCANVTFQWQENNGTSWNNLVDGGKYAGSSSANFHITSATVDMSNFRYRCLLTNAFLNQLLTSDSVSLVVKYSADANTIFHDTTINGGTETNQAVLTITATNKILSNAHVNYFAGNAIYLNPGFEVQNGSIFLGKIAYPCPSALSGVPEILKK